jgi:hypothetical protein
MPKTYENRENRLIIKQEVEEKMTLERLLNLKNHYEKDVIHYTARLADIDEMIAKAQELGVTAENET